MRRGPVCSWRFRSGRGQGDRVGATGQVQRTANGKREIRPDILRPPPQVQGRAHGMHILFLEEVRV